jgi:hypothetical protein
MATGVNEITELPRNAANWTDEFHSSDAVTKQVRVSGAVNEYQ